MNQRFRPIYCLISIIILLAACTPFDTQQIKTIDSFEQAQKDLENVDKDTLVIFDCDETLVVPVEKLVSPLLHSDPVVQQIKTDFITFASTKPDPITYSNLIRSKMYLKCSYRPVEQSMIDEINKLLQRGIKVIALTAQDAGPVFGGCIPSFVTWRYEKLQTLGIDLSSSFDQQDVILVRFPASSTRNIAAFYKGILCSAEQPKGEVLTAFLDSIGYKPSKVIFFDDISENVESVAKAMKKKGIQFQGYVYRAAHKISEHVDSDMLRFQLDYIKKHDDVITEDEARVLKD